VCKFILFHQEKLIFIMKTIEYSRLKSFYFNYFRLNTVKCNGFQSFSGTMCFFNNTQPDDFESVMLLVSKKLGSCLDSIYRRIVQFLIPKKSECFGQ
jgi:hypothetical protein